MRHGSVIVALAAVVAALPLVAAASGSGEAETDARAIDRSAEGSGVPWYAPWRAVRIRTVEDAVRAWAMVREFFGNMRDGHAHEVWETDPEAMPPPRPLEDCLAALEDMGLDWPRVDLACRMSAQVRVANPVEGVRFVVWDDEGDWDFDVGCELAVRLPRLARVLRELDVVEVAVGPPARFTLRSYHRFGLALDVYKIGLEDGTKIVVRDGWELRSERGTCEGPEPESRPARVLREIACRLWDERVLSTVITPNYNEGHRNHYHWDVRPGDERFYLR